MSTGLTDADRDVLLQRIHDKECTPFVGAGACAGTLPLAGELAAEWADAYGYPLEDPLLVSHGSDVGPRLIRLSAERKLVTPGLVRWLTELP